MLKLKGSTRFKKDFKKYRHNQFLIEEFETIVILLRKKKKLPEKNRDHTLSGEYFGFRECHIKPDVLLIYNSDEEFLYLARIGSHSELF